MTETTAVYAEIVKHERDANGDLVVFGRATGPDLDLDRQICDPAWLKTAMPTWFQTGANVREQHSSIAAGVGTEIAQKPDGGWDLKSLVVDSNSARKVERGVLKGYSIGIRNPRVVKDTTAPGGRIIDGQIVEVSLVDRPANPTCQLTLAKALKPGPMTVAPGTIDLDRSLVKVEELHENVEAALDRGLEEFEAELTKRDLSAELAELAELTKGLDLVAVRKGDRKGDIRNAKKAVALIAALIQSEAVCLAEDVDYEACDIELLLGAARSLHWFICREKKEPTVAHVELAETPDTAKAVAPDAAPTAPAEQEPQTPPPAVEKAADGGEGGDGNVAPKDDLTELVKALTAKVGDLEGQLTKAMNAPAPGGPVLTRTTETTVMAEAKEDHLAKAAHWERLAYEVSDQTTRAGYLQLAQNERAATS